MFNAIMPVLVEQIPGEAMCDKNKNDKVVQMVDDAVKYMSENNSKLSQMIKSFNH